MAEVGFIQIHRYWQKFTFGFQLLGRYRFKRSISHFCS